MPNRCLMILAKAWTSKKKKKKVYNGCWLLKYFGLYAPTRS